MVSEDDDLSALTKSFDKWSIRSKSGDSARPSAAVTQNATASTQFVTNAASTMMKINSDPPGPSWDPTATTAVPAATSVTRPSGFAETKKLLARIKRLRDSHTPPDDPELTHACNRLRAFETTLQTIEVEWRAARHEIAVALDEKSTPKKQGESDQVRKRKYSGGYWTAPGQLALVNARNARHPAPRGAQKSQLPAELTSPTGLNTGTTTTAKAVVPHQVQAKTYCFDEQTIVARYRVLRDKKVPESHQEVVKVRKQINAVKRLTGVYPTAYDIPAFVDAKKVTATGTMTPTSWNRFPLEIRQIVTTHLIQAILQAYLDTPGFKGNAKFGSDLLSLRLISYAFVQDDLLLSCRRASQDWYRRFLDAFRSLDAYKESVKAVTDHKLRHWNYCVTGGDIHRRTLKLQRAGNHISFVVCKSDKHAWRKTDDHIGLDVVEYNPIGGNHGQVLICVYCQRAGGKTDDVPEHLVA